MNRALAAFALVCAGSGCLVQPFNEEGKRCRTDDLCEAPFVCVLDPGTSAGRCRREPCSGTDAGGACVNACAQPGVARCDAPPGGTIEADHLVRCDVPPDAGPCTTVSVTPNDVAVLPGTRQGFSAVVSGASSQEVTWSVAEGAGGGVIDSLGNYQAPCAVGAFHVVARSVAAPAASGSALVRVSALPATFDACFAGTGRRVLPIGSGYDEGHNVVLQPDGKIVVSGKTAGSAGDLDFAVLRFLPDGSLDPGFGAGGKAFWGVGNGLRDEPRTLALQPDGKLVLAGHSGNQLAVVRFTALGALDPAFGSGGVALSQASPSSSDEAWAVALQPTGELVLAGASATASGTQLLVERFSAAGVFDSTFGYRLFSFGSPSVGRGVAVVDGGVIVAAGYGQVAASRAAQVLVALGPTGAPAAAFGDGGTVTTPLLGSNEGWLLVPAPEDKLLVVGRAVHDAGTADFAVTRYLPSGALDPTFGGGAGYVLTNVTGGRNDDIAFGAALQADGRIVAVGVASNFTQDVMGLVRYLPSGAPDTSFGPGGRVLVPFDATLWSHAISVAIQPDGRIVVTGNAQVTGGDYDVALLRLWP